MRHLGMVAAGKQRVCVTPLLALEFQVTDNQCQGRLEIVWHLGSGRPRTTAESTLVYRFAKQGSYQVSVTPRCIRKTRACDGSTVSARVTTEMRISLVEIISMLMPAS